MSHGPVSVTFPACYVGGNRSAAAPPGINSLFQAVPGRSLTAPERGKRAAAMGGGRGAVEAKRDLAGVSHAVAHPVVGDPHRGAGDSIDVGREGLGDICDPHSFTFADGCF